MINLKTQSTRYSLVNTTPTRYPLFKTIPTRYPLVKTIPTRYHIVKTIPTRYNLVKTDSVCTKILANVAVADLMMTVVTYIPKLVTAYARKWVLGPVVCFATAALNPLPGSGPWCFLDRVFLRQHSLQIIIYICDMRLMISTNQTKSPKLTPITFDSVQHGLPRGVQSLIHSI